MINNLLTYIEETYLIEISKRVLKFLRRNMGVLFNIVKNEKNYVILLKTLTFLEFKAYIGKDDIADADIVLRVFPMVKFTHYGEEKTYTYKPAELRLNAKITIGDSINIDFGKISFFMEGSGESHMTRTL